MLQSHRFIILGNFKKLIISCLAALIALSCNAQKTKTLIAFSDSSSGQVLWGFKTKDGIVKIKPKYNWTDSKFLKYGAFVMSKEASFIAINQDDSVILIPYIFDNGPDYLSEGLFRFIENGKIGFANKQFKKIIPAKFDFVYPFENGYAIFNAGGKKAKFDEEHSYTSGGLWGLIDKKGKIVVEAKYLNLSSYKKKYYEATLPDNTKTIINHKGDVVKILNN